MGNTHECERILKKIDQPFPTLCVLSSLCGSRADLQPFCGFYWNRFDFSIILYIRGFGQILNLRSKADDHISELGPPVWIPVQKEG